MRDMTIYEAVTSTVWGWVESSFFLAESAANDYLEAEKIRLQEKHDDETGDFADQYSFYIKPVTVITGRQIGSTYLLQNISAGYLGNSPYFWAVTGGYSPWIEEAKEFTREAAEKVISATAGSHKWRIWPLSDIDKVARKTIDIQDLQ